MAAHTSVVYLLQPLGGNAPNSHFCCSYFLVNFGNKKKKKMLYAEMETRFVILDSCPQSLSFLYNQASYRGAHYLQQCSVQNCPCLFPLECAIWCVHRITCCVDVGDGDVQLLLLRFCSVHPAAALGLHYVVTPGSEGGKNVAFNWTLFRPIWVQRIESDPSVGCCLSVPWLKNTMRRVACLWMDMSATAACHILMTGPLKCSF